MKGEGGSELFQFDFMFLCLYMLRRFCHTIFRMLTLSHPHVFLFVFTCLALDACTEVVLLQHFLSHSLCVCLFSCCSHHNLPQQMCRWTVVSLCRIFAFCNMSSNNALLRRQRQRGSLHFTQQTLMFAWLSYHILNSFRDAAHLSSTFPLAEQLCDDFVLSVWALICTVLRVHTVTWHLNSVSSAGNPNATWTIGSSQDLHGVKTA